MRMSTIVIPGISFSYIYWNPNRKNLWPLSKWTDYNSYAKPQRIANVINNVILALTCTFTTSFSSFWTCTWVRKTIEMSKVVGWGKGQGSGQSLGLNVNNNNATATIVMMK